MSVLRKSPTGFAYDTEKMVGKLFSFSRHCQWYKVFTENPLSARFGFKWVSPTNFVIVGVDNQYEIFFRVLLGDGTLGWIDDFWLNTWIEMKPDQEE